MKIYFYLGILLFSSSIYAQVSFEDLIPASPIAKSQISSLVNSLKHFQRINSQNNYAEVQSDDLIIGDDDPNEIVTITGNFFLNGNLQIINNGKLILDHASFQINGNIEISGTGELIATGGSFEVIQTFTYEYSTVIFESGLFKFDSVQFSSSGQS